MNKLQMQLMDKVIVLGKVDFAVCKKKHNTRGPFIWFPISANSVRRRVVTSQQEGRVYIYTRLHRHASGKSDIIPINSMH